MIGTTVGSYRIVSQLGAGGMGVVYKAMDQRLQRHVALKVLPPSVSTDEGRRRRFLQEARAASALNDPHIITIHDIFEHQGTDVLVMELVEGCTLREAISGPMAIPRAVEWTRQIADALSVAHGAGIVHRDLKPGNVMVADRGGLKVLDFGLAKVSMAEDEATVAPATVEGDLLGTVEYMSPEQARGKPVDHRTDIYSLGAILYEMLAGRRPFVASNRLALLQEIAHDTPTPLRSLRPEVSEALEDVVTRALARDPQLRFQSMWELSAALKFAANLGPASAPSGAAAPASSGAGQAPGVAPSAASGSAPANASASAVLPGRRKWAVAALAAGIAVVAGLVALGLRPWRATDPAVGPQTPSARAAPSPMPGTTLELTQQGLAALRYYDMTGNIDTAIASLEAAVAKDKASAPAWAGLARAYWRKHLMTRDDSWRARALDAAKQAVALDSLFAGAHVSLGLVTLAGGDMAAARKAFDRALILDPNNAGAHRGQGAIAKAADRNAEARTHYARALALDPTDWEVMWLQGEIDYQSGRYQEALAWYTRAKDAAPDSPTPHRLVGAALHMLGDYAGAAAAFQTSLSLQPTAATYTNLGTVLFFQGLYRESVQAFERGVELAPANPLQWGNLGDAYRWVPGNEAKSRDAYTRAIQLLREQLARDPTQSINRSRLALYLAKSGDTTAALTELGKVLTPDVAEVNTLFRAAVTYEVAGRRDDALAALERALDRGYGLIEIRMDPELANLRNDVRYHRLAARFDSAAKK